MAGIKPFLILTVAALDFTIMPRRVRTDQLVPDAQFSSSFLKQRWNIAPAVGETVGKLKAIVRLDTLNFNSMPGIPFDQLFQEIRGGIGRLLRIGSQKAQSCKFVNSRYWNSRSSGSAMQVLGTTLTST